MRNLTTLTLLCAVALTFACNKNENANIGDKKLIGKWQLSETLADPGNGSGKWTAVSGDDAKKYFKLKADGTTEGTAFEGYTKYAVKDSLFLRLIKPDKSAILYRFNISNTSLTLSPDSPSRCIEACGTLFKRAKD